MSLASLLPEASRNVRIQLRPRRALAAALISGIASVTAFVSYGHGDAARGQLFGFALGAGITVLTMGGGIYCLQSIHREKELNTFDYQRITRLTPLELTLGKLFGAPSFTYFIALCLLPITLVGASLSSVTMTTLLWIYALVVLTAIAWHAFALMVSLFVGRGSAVGAIILFLILLFMGIGSDGDRSSMLAFQGINPYFVLQAAEARVPAGSLTPMQLPLGQDLLFGTAVSHALVLAALYGTLTGWFLFGLVRNIKRDPSLYEIYSPLQGFAFVLYLHLIVLAFFQWDRVSSHYTNGSPPNLVFEQHTIAPLQAENEFLGASLVFFVVFGVVLLRNRERVRRRLLELANNAASWWAALWPAPYLFGGIMAVGLAMIALIRYKLSPQAEWSFGLAFFEVCFVAAWIVRDLLYLQWMNLRNGRRPLAAAFIYLLVFYVCSSTLFAGMVSYRSRVTDFGVYAMPWAIFNVSFAGWTGATAMWIGAFIALVLEALVFAALQHRQLLKLRESAAV